MKDSNEVAGSKAKLQYGLGAGSMQPASSGGSGRKSMNGSRTPSVVMVSPASNLPLPLLSRKPSSPRVKASTVTMPEGGMLPSVMRVALATPLESVGTGSTIEAPLVVKETEVP